MAATSHFPKSSKIHSLVDMDRKKIATTTGPNFGSQTSLQNQLASTSTTKTGKKSWSVGQMKPTEITIEGFHEHGVSHWTFSEALLYSITILTTIGKMSHTQNN